MPGSGTGTSSSHSPGSGLALTNAGMVCMTASLKWIADSLQQVQGIFDREE